MAKVVADRDKDRDFDVAALDVWLCEGGRGHRNGRPDADRQCIEGATTRTDQAVDQSRGRPETLRQPKGIHD